MTPTQIAIFFPLCICIITLLFIVCLYCHFILDEILETTRLARRESNEQKGEVKYMNATCEYCGKRFEWEDDEAIFKYKYGSRFVVHCPYCDKLTKVDIDK